MPKICYGVMVVTLSWLVTSVKKGVLFLRSTTWSCSLARERSKVSCYDIL